MIDGKTYIHKLLSRALSSYNVLKYWKGILQSSHHCKILMNNYHKYTHISMVHILKLNKSCI